MKGRVLRPIPGTGYGIGDLASFDEERAEKYKEFLKNKEYFKELADGEDVDETPARLKRQLHRAGDPDPISTPEPAPKPKPRRDDDDEEEPAEEEEPDAENEDEEERKKIPAKAGKEKATAKKGETAIK